MCLEVDEDKTKTLKESTEKCFTRYKVVKAFVWHTTFSFHSMFYNHVWFTGWNYARGVIATWTPKQLYTAIHVYVSEADAKKIASEYNAYPKSCEWGTVVVMPVKCYIEDLIAVGDGNGMETEGYKRVYLESYPEVAIWRAQCV